MTAVTDKDYQKLAEAVSEDLVQQRIPLNESITKLATKMELTDEQIARLCETTNNTTFNKMFKAKGADKTASDRLVEFDVADKQKVLGSLIKRAERNVDTAKTASYLDFADLPDSMHEVRNPEPESTGHTKEAFVLRPEGGPSKEADIRTLRKVAAHLRQRKTAAELEYVDCMGELHTQFKRVYTPPFSKFEKQAAALHGKTAEAHLNHLRGLLRMPEVTYNTEVLSKTAGFVDDSGPEFVLFSKLLKTASELSDLTAAIKKLEGVL